MPLCFTSERLLTARNFLGLPSVFPLDLRSLRSRRVAQWHKPRLAVGAAALPLVSVSCPSPRAVGFPFTLPYPASAVPLEVPVLHLRQDSTLPPASARASPTAVMAAAGTAVAAEPTEVLVKAATGNPEQLGDCPFSHKVLLVLEEAKIPYSLRLVDTTNKPQWFLDASPEGKVPVLKRGDKWVPDSDEIVKALEEDYPAAQQLQSSPKDAAVASALFPAFAKFLKGTGPEEDLVKQLQELDSALAASGGPFVAGKAFTTVDARIAPALHHIQIALGHYKNWSIPKSLTHVYEYIKALEARDSFKKTAAPPEVVIAGWDKALGVKPAA